MSAATEGEDPVQLLVMAGRNYVPVDHTQPLPPEEKPIIPKSNERASIVDIVTGITHELWYIDQITHRRTIEAKEPQIGKLDSEGLLLTVIEITSL